MLAYEVQVFRLNEARWQEQLDALSPQFVLVEVPHPPGWSDASIRKLSEGALDRGIPAVAWITEEGAIVDPVYAGFRPHLVNGSLQPRLHNPVLVAPRSDRVLSLSERRLGALATTDPWALAYLPKRYKQVIVAATVDSRTLDRLAATCTRVTKSDQDELREASSDWSQARADHAAMRDTLRRASIRSDIDRMLEEARKPVVFTRTPIDVVVEVGPTTDVQKVMAILSHQTYPWICLTVTLDNRVEREGISEFALQAGLDNLEIVQGGVAESSEERLLHGLASGESDLVALMNEADYYGPEYLSDLALSLEFSSADVVGKRAHVAYFAQGDQMVYLGSEYEHRFTDSVCPATMLVRRDVLELHGHSSRSISGGKSVTPVPIRLDARVYSADRWNYLRMSGTPAPLSEHVVGTGRDVELVTG